MKLHRLRIRAFGPFADDTEIDFDELSADGLFLLHGQTGAGKSTILDAVAFALFGRVPGARNENRRLHSDHARPEEVPEVELETTISGRRMRIRRSPEHERPKKRGDGTTKINARATLEWIDGSGENLTRIPEIADKIIELLGMSADQFFQVVLLPQGDFARFLRANSDDREALLERLFDTERFGGVEEWLRDRTKISAASLTDRMAVVERVAGQIVAVSGTEMPSEPDMEWAHTVRDDSRIEREVSSELLATARAEVEAAQTAHDTAIRLADLYRRGEEAGTRLDQLRSGEAELADVTAALAAAQKVAPVIPLVDDHDRAVTAVASADDEVARAHASLATPAEAVRIRDLDVDAIDAAIARWMAESGRWRPLAEREGRRPTLSRDIDKADRELGTLRARVADVEKRIETAPARRADLVAALTAARADRERIALLDKESADLEALAKAVRTRSRLLGQIETAARGLLDVRDEHNSAREHLLDIREQRLAGMAAELASQLTADEPCVVCGSRQHPNPAVGDAAATVTDADEVAAVEAEKLVAVRLTRADSAHGALIERRRHLDEQIGDTTHEEVETRRQRISAELARVRTSAERVEGLERSVAALDDELKSLQAAQAADNASASALGERLTTLRTDMRSLYTEIAEATGGQGDVAGRIADLEDLCRRARILRDARRRAADAHARLSDLADRLKKACGATGLGSADDMRAAAASPEQTEKWSDLLRDADRLRAAAKATLDEPEVIEALASGPVDTDRTLAHLTQCRTRRDEASNRHALATRTHNDLERYVADFWNAHDGLVPLIERHAELQGLTDLVAGRGQNSRRMSLRSYVLAARLEEVLVAASARLRQMSSGRYEFVHTDAAGPRGRRGGLGIDVRDEYTGAVRAATTLSGGETFFASLALALGLADVVSAESGGRVLDTMFIDEGFGTLDPETLDLVMGVLDELRSGGRVVGLVSHVDELRARIPTQLHLLRGEDGSKVRMLGALGVS